MSQMFMRSHYYFKFGAGNKYLQTNIGIGEDTNLFIFFNSTNVGWKVESFLQKGHFNQSAFYAKSKNENLKESDIQQSAEFIKISLPENRNNAYLWVFYHPKIFVFQPVEIVKDGDPNKNIEDGQQPKSFKAKCINIFSVDEVPNSFATLHANQAYNRKTLVKFKIYEEKIAEYLINRKNSNEKIKIDVASERFMYLSPVQLETLVFLLFHHSGAFCSSYRGGTLKDIDLKVDFPEESDFPEFKRNTSCFFQIKKTDSVFEWNAHNKNEFLIWLGLSDPSRQILGIDWLELSIQKYHQVENWLNHSLWFIDVDISKNANRNPNR